MYGRPPIGFENSTDLSLGGNSVFEENEEEEGEEMPGYWPGREMPRTFLYSVTAYRSVIPLTKSSMRMSLT